MLIILIIRVQSSNKVAKPSISITIAKVTKTKKIVTTIAKSTKIIIRFKIIKMISS